MRTLATWITASLCVLAALGCAKTMQAGNDGATHFLVECERDAECGELSCLCGVCSKACDGDTQCDGLGGDAECLGASRSSCDMDKSCALECVEDDDCDALAGDARCDSGRCVRPAAPVGNDAGQGGSGGTAGSAGTSGSGGAGGGSDVDAGSCAAMDAADDGTRCDGLVGFTFDGSGCNPISCGCTGDDCDALFPTLRACERAYSACVATPCAQMDARSAGTLCGGTAGYSWDGAQCREVLCTCEGEDCDAIYETLQGCIDAHRACAPALTMCVSPSDCVLASTQYCSCNEVTELDVVAISESQVSALDLRLMEVNQACPECENDPWEGLRERFLPQCVSATDWEGHQCTLLDTERLPCTQELGCRLRARTCCECGAVVEFGDFIAIPNGSGDVAERALCEPGQGCPECEPDYGSAFEALCSDEGFCEVRYLGTD